jgi:DNA-binding transcriptional regulator YiaG
MTADEYRAILAALELSQTSAAKLLGVDEGTSRRWARGARAIPPAVARLLQVLQHFDIAPAEAFELFNRSNH